MAYLVAYYTAGAPPQILLDSACVCISRAIPSLIATVVLQRTGDFRFLTQLSIAFSVQLLLSVSSLQTMVVLLQRRGSNSYLLPASKALERVLSSPNTERSSLEILQLLLFFRGLVMTHLQAPTPIVLLSLLINEQSCTQQQSLNALPL